MGIEDYKPKIEKGTSNEDTAYMAKIDTDQEIDKEVDEIFSTKQTSLHLIKDEKKLAERIGIPVLMLNVIIVVLLLCAACLIFLAYGYYSTIEITTYNEVAITKNITTEIKGFSKITFGKYLIDEERYNGKEVTVKGFLSESSIVKGEVAYLRIVLVDDLGNTITLENADKYKIFVPEDGLSNTLYNIKGIFKKGYDYPAISVEELIPTVREEDVIDSKIETINTAEMVKTKTIVPKYPFMHGCACSKYDAADPEINFRFRICKCTKQAFVFDIADYDY